jgi:hypothetical protein
MLVDCVLQEVFQWNVLPSAFSLLPSAFGLPPSANIPAAFVLLSLSVPEGGMQGVFTPLGH